MNGCSIIVDIDDLPDLPIPADDCDMIEEIIKSPYYIKTIENCDNDDVVCAIDLVHKPPEISFKDISIIQISYSYNSENTNRTKDQAIKLCDSKIYNARYFV